MQPGSPRQVEKHRFLLELWLEPREVASRILRLRGRIQDLASKRSRAVGGLDDVGSFIEESMGSDGVAIGRESES